MKNVLFVILFLLFPALIFGAGIQVSWDPNTESDLAGYKIYFGTASGVYGAPIDVGNNTTYIFNNATEKNTYYIVLTAYDTSGNESAYSVESSILIPTEYPPVPAAPTLALNVNTVNVSWASVEGAASYKVYYGTVSGTYTGSLTSTGTTASFTGLDNTTYYVAVSSIDAGGDESGRSAEVSVKVPDNTKPAPPSKPRLSIWEKIALFFKNLFG